MAKRRATIVAPSTGFDWKTLMPEIRRLLVHCSVMAFMTLLATGPAAADASGGLIGERPNAGGPPDEVGVRFALLDIDAIDDKEQRFSVDAYFELSWLDPRLAVDANLVSTVRVRSVSLDDIWNPGLTIVNNRGLTPMLPNVAEVDNKGHVVVRQRISGKLAVNLDLRGFPFDTQQLAFDIVSYKYSPSELRFSADTRFVANTSAFSADGWQFDIRPPEHSVFRLHKDGAGSPMLALPVTAERKASFFVLTLALPMILILFMAWAVHWLEPDIVPARMGMSTATVFSLIALGVSFRLSLPRVDYLTLADRFVIFSTLLVLLSLGVTVIATRLLRQDRESSAVRLTTYARWGFPAVVALIIVSVLV